MGGKGCNAWNRTTIKTRGCQKCESIYQCHGPPDGEDGAHVLRMRTHIERESMVPGYCVSKLIAVVDALVPDSSIDADVQSLREHVFLRVAKKQPLDQRNEMTGREHSSVRLSNTVHRANCKMLMLGQFGSQSNVRLFVRLSLHLLIGYPRLLDRNGCCSHGRT